MPARAAPVCTTARCPSNAPHQPRMIAARRKEAAALAALDAGAAGYDAVARSVGYAGRSGAWKAVRRASGRAGGAP